jgi:hypothetical protein
MGQKCWENVAMAFVGEEIDDHAHPLLKNIWLGHYHLAYVCNLVRY